eukprot:m.174984 g.174984  ORF g.174984 m.174984 type:complete len:264 (-) comp18346_c0_seq3:307-1098(-)
METSANNKAFDTVKVHHYLGIEPPFLSDVGTGIREQLEADLMAYSKKFKGVPIAVLDVVVRDATGSIFGDSGSMFVNVDATYRVFSPRAGQSLLGVVNKVSVDHIGMLVDDKFNASIPREEIPSQYEYDAELMHWCDRDFDNPMISAGSTVSFAVKTLETADAVFSVIGSLTAPHTGLVTKSALERMSSEGAGSDPIVKSSKVKTKVKKERKEKKEKGDGVSKKRKTKDANLNEHESTSITEPKKAKKAKSEKSKNSKKQVKA